MPRSERNHFLKQIIFHSKYFSKWKLTIFYRNNQILEEELTGKVDSTIILRGQNKTIKQSCIKVRTTQI